MKYRKKDYIIIKSKIDNPVKLTGNKTRAFIVTEQHGYTLKNIYHSNTYIVHDIKNDECTLSSGLYELEENSVKYEIINKILEFTTDLGPLSTNLKNSKPFSFEVNQIPDDLCDIKLLKQAIVKIVNSEINLISIKNIQNIFGYGNDQIDSIVKYFRLCKITDDLYLRFSYKEIRKMLVMMQSMKLTNSKEEVFLSFYPDFVLDFLNAYFVGDSVEISVYLFLELYHSKILNVKNKFKEMVTEMIFDDINTSKMIEMIENIYIDQKTDIIKKILEL